MTTKEINKKLRIKFDSHKYILENSYVYNWESDFFSITTSGYSQEIEIKLSKQDFLADFLKVDKHNTIKAKFNSQPFILKKGYNTYQYEFEELQTLIIDGKRQYDEETGKPIKVPSGKIKKGTLTTHDIEKFLSNHCNTNYQQISTEITIEKTPIAPNRFSYISPTAIIPLELVPEYAGLYYINENMRVTEIKKAPLIHKEKEDLTKILLDKFYYLSLKQRSLL